MRFYEAFVAELTKLATKAFFVGGKRMMTGPGGALQPFKKMTRQVPKTPEQKLRKQVATLRARGVSPGIDRPTRLGKAKIPGALKGARAQAQQISAPMY